MIIGNLDIKYIACFESETNSPLIIDANAPLFIPVTRQFFKPVSRWDTQFLN